MLYKTRVLLYDPLSRRYESVAANRYAPWQGAGYQATWNGRNVVLYGGPDEGFMVHTFDPKTKSFAIVNITDDRMVRGGFYKTFFWTGDSVVEIGKSDGAGGFGYVVKLP